MKTYEISKAEQLPATNPPDVAWGNHFDAECGFAVRLTEKYVMSVFVDRRLGSKGELEGIGFVKGPEQVIAHCISCVGEQWEVRAEPVEGGLGLVIYTSKGKALAAGEWRYEGANGAFFMKNLYAGITNKLSLVGIDVKGGVAGNGDWYVYGAVAVSDSRL
jgi:hypothetical protein